MLDLSRNNKQGKKEEKWIYKLNKDGMREYGDSREAQAYEAYVREHRTHRIKFDCDLLERDDSETTLQDVGYTVWLLYEPTSSMSKNSGGTFGDDNEIQAMIVNKDNAIRFREVELDEHLSIKRFDMSDDERHEKNDEKNKKTYNAVKDVKFIVTYDQLTDKYYRYIFVSRADHHFEAYVNSMLSDSCTNVLDVSKMNDWTGKEFNGDKNNSKESITLLDFEIDFQHVYFKAVCRTSND